MRSSTSRRVLLDADTGLDDALALIYLTAMPHAELLGVTGVDGCVGADVAARNSLAVLHAIGAAQIPVGATAGQYNGTVSSAPVQAFGPGGLGRVPLTPNIEPHVRDAIDLMAEILQRDREPTTLLCTGPLTNAARLLRDRPDAARWIDEIFVMGGSVSAGGNVTAAAEFNILRDPEAADAVFLAGVPTVVYGLDVFVEPAVSLEELNPGVAKEHPRLRIARLLLDELRRLFPGRGAFLGDAGAAVVMLNRDLAMTQSHPARVELVGAHTRGATVVDRRDTPQSDWSRLDFVTAIQADAVVAEFVDTINRGA